MLGFVASVCHPSTLRTSMCERFSTTMVFDMITKSKFAPVLQGNTFPQVPAQIWLSEDIRDFAAFWPRTTELGAARSWVFQCADIVEVWCDTIGTARHIQPLFVAVVDAESRPLALFPLGIERRQGARVLTFLDGGVCDYNAPILFPAARHWDPPIVRAIWRALAKALPPFDIAILEKADRSCWRPPQSIDAFIDVEFSKLGACGYTLWKVGGFRKETLAEPADLVGDIADFANLAWSSSKLRACPNSLMPFSTR